MNGLIDILAEIEAAGAVLRLDGDKVRICYQDELQREQLAQHVGFLRARRDEVAEWLRARTAIPPMPPGVRLLSWNLKQAPVAIDTCSVVTEPAMFARSTLEQLRVSLAEPKRWVGWTVSQLVDRLQQVGVVVELEEPHVAAWG